MAVVTLRPVDKTNYDEIAVLSHTLTPEQQTWVAHNAVSILDAHYQFGLDILGAIVEVRGIYADGDPVGLVLWAHIPEAGQPREFKVVRLMIGGAYQGKGYGRAALQQVMEIVRASGADALDISFVPENTAAAKLYASLGFVDTGVVRHGEVVYRMEMKAKG